MKRATATLAALLLAGCASQPIATSEARPSEEILAPAMTEPREGTERVIVKRDDGFNCGGWNHRVFVSGQPVAEVSPGEKVTLYLEPGTHMLAAKLKGTCGGQIAELQIEVEPGAHTVYRISVGPSSDTSLTPTAF